MRVKYKHNNTTKNNRYAFFHLMIDIVILIVILNYLNLSGEPEILNMYLEGRDKH